MLGFYNYTVWLTYLSFLSACAGMAAALGFNNPVWAVGFLMFSGLCDAFDGKVAATKKNRTAVEKRYGIQIDSLSDIAAFGILPSAIGLCIVNTYFDIENTLIKVLLYVIMLGYSLAALIRLAYFNVTEEERQKEETGSRKHYTGLPVTSAALVFPAAFLGRLVSDNVFIVVFFTFMLLSEFAFVSGIKVKKPGFKAIVALTFFGLIEFALVYVFIFCMR